MMRLIFLIALSILMSAGPSRADSLDLSTPQSAYDTCYAAVDFTTPPKIARAKIGACLTPTAQKALISYAVLGAHFIDSLKDLKGQQKSPDFLPLVNETLNKHELLGGSRMAFQQADLAAALADLLEIYATHPITIEKLQYSDRTLKNIEISGNTATGTEKFKLISALPANKLELRFVKLDNKWLINHISHRQ